MDIVTKVMVWLGDRVFALLSFFSPEVAMWIISALTGVLMLLIWRFTSNQDAIADVRRKISSNLLATRLFKDNLAVTFRSQRQIIWQAFRLLLYSFRPMVIMMVPFVLVMVQIGLHYEYRPADVGKVIGVTAMVKGKAKLQGVADQLALPDGVVADANDPCRAQSMRTIDWRITPTKAGTFTLVFGEGRDTVEIPLEAGDRFARVSSLCSGAFFDRLLYSGEPSIPESSVFESIRIHYPNRVTPICGIEVHWLISLLILSIVFALIFKPIFKVHI